MADCCVSLVDTVVSLKSKPVICKVLFFCPAEAGGRLHESWTELGAAERGVQGVQLHTLEIMWVCKTPFLRTLASTDVCLTNGMLLIPAHNP